MNLILSISKVRNLNLIICLLLLRILKSILPILLFWIDTTVSQRLLFLYYFYKNASTESIFIDNLWGNQGIIYSFSHNCTYSTPPRSRYLKLHLESLQSVECVKSSQCSQHSLTLASATFASCIKNFKRTFSLLRSGDDDGDLILKVSYIKSFRFGFCVAISPLVE